MTGFHSAGETSGSDSSLGVQTPEGIEFALYPAGFLIRACACVIDISIQGALLIAILIATAVFERALGVWFSLILIFILDWFYHTVFEVFWRGQSPGKRFMGIRVVRPDGSPVNPGASFLRNLLRFADTFMFLYLIAFICMLFSPAFRRIGDWVADTLVVYTAHARTPGRFMSPALKRAAMPWLSGVPMISPCRKLRYEEKQAVLSFARRYPLLGRARADEIAGIWAGKLRGDAAPETGQPDSIYMLGIAHTLDG